MASNQTLPGRDTRLTDVLRKVDDDVSKFAPPAVREVRNKIEPAQDMLSVTDSAAERIMSAVEEAEKQVEAAVEESKKQIAELRVQAEHYIGKSKLWATEFENRRAAIMAHTNELVSRVHEHCEKMMSVIKENGAE